jgi:hypothetical protein
MKGSGVGGETRRTTCVSENQPKNIERRMGRKIEIEKRDKGSGGY